MVLLLIYVWVFIKICGYCSSFVVTMISLLLLFKIICAYHAFMLAFFGHQLSNYVFGFLTLVGVMTYGNWKDVLVAAIA